MTSVEIRRKFLQFFQDKGHQIVPSAPLVVKNDPTLMFTNAGMNQFKDFFLGTKDSDNKRVADTQKCLRVSGKHNDLEDVGKDTYHHTMFEMLGNWSFGDYFKKEAIEWAWELLTAVYQLPKDRLYATVFEGDKADGLKLDEEATIYWKNFLPEDRILPASKKDNFWEMGDTGPCGPCSEIHIDLRSDDEVAKQPGVELVNKDHPEVVEIWNLVFIQFNRLADGSLQNLPAKHVDTGMGFERLTMAIQGKKSNYDTDVFTPLIEKIEQLSGVSYGISQKTDIAIRVVVDHVRAVTFAIADGQLPSNNKAGYVIRRILRRAIRYGYSFLNLKEPFLFQLVDVLNRQMGEFFPELGQQSKFVSKAIQEEEIAFLRTLDKGLSKLDQIKGQKEISGKDAFELYDTFGFPPDLTNLIAAEYGMKVDVEGFEKHMAVQKDRSRSASELKAGDWVVLKEGAGEFVGYDQLDCKSFILRYREVVDKKKKMIQLVLDKTPFYAESGGQIGDSGLLVNEKETICIFDTKKENDLIVHITDKLPKHPEHEFQAKVNEEKRRLTADNHSATHLLHAALRLVLGNHVEQRGSLVTDEILRFDFSHFSKMTYEELLKVEELVNQRIRQNIRLDEKRNIPINEAKSMGATALFGEKYGDFVRVITFDPSYSVELCGGTHVQQTGEIGFFKIISESSISAGVRRIEAVTAAKAEQLVQSQWDNFQDLNDLLKTPKDLKKAVENLIQERNHLQKEIEKLQLSQAGQVKNQLKTKIQTSNGYSILIARADFPSADMVKKIAFELKNEVNGLLLGLASLVNEKPLLTVMIDEDVVKKTGLNAGNIVRSAAKNIKGGGGGQPFYATAGGKDAVGLDAALHEIEAIFSKVSE